MGEWATGGRRGQEAPPRREVVGLTDATLSLRRLYRRGGGSRAQGRLVPEGRGGGGGLVGYRRGELAPGAEGLGRLKGTGGALHRRTPAAHDALPSLWGLVWSAETGDPLRRVSLASGPRGPPLRKDGRA